MKKYMLLILLLLMIIPLYVNAASMKAADYIKKIANDNGGSYDSIDLIADTGLAYDGTEDNNLRYVGKNPNNYLTFNDRYPYDVYYGYYPFDDGTNSSLYYIFNSLEECESSTKYKWCEKKHSQGDLILWRIVGLFGNDIKIVRNESIGIYSIHHDQNDTNDFGSKDIIKLLNDNYENNTIGGSLFYKSKKGTCYSIGINTSNGTKECNFESIGLGTNAKNYIIEHTWNIKGDINLSALQSYQNEKSNTWTGKIGFLNYSDIGLSTSGGNDYSRDECLNATIGYYGDYRVFSNHGCASNSYLNSKRYLFQINATKAYVYYDDYSGGTKGISSASQSSSLNIFPAAFINADNYIISGIGSIDNPYVIGIPIFSSISTKNDASGKITIDVEDTTFVEYGRIVKITIIPEYGYEVEKIEIEDQSNNMIEYRKTDKENEYEFTMPDSDIVITPTYKKIESTSFPNSINNPNTRTGISIIIIFMLIMSSITYITLKEKKNNYYK